VAKLVDCDLRLSTVAIAKSFGRESKIAQEWLKDSDFIGRIKEQGYQALPIGMVNDNVVL